MFRLDDNRAGRIVVLTMVKDETSDDLFSVASTLSKSSRSRSIGL